MTKAANSAATDCDNTVGIVPLTENDGRLAAGVPELYGYQVDGGTPQEALATRTTTCVAGLEAALELGYAVPQLRRLAA